MIAGRYNHPCIVQWEVFNEGDCVAQFNAPAMVQLVQELDPSRLVDTGLLSLSLSVSVCLSLTHSHMLRLHFIKFIPAEL